ncbi:hypothetical protein L3X07_04210 [Levilactobacillus brevis]|nr:hypothetical protein [Levilactobacillus brevis]
MQKQLDNRWHIGHRLLLAIVVVVSFISGSVLIGHAETAPSVEPTSSTSNAVTSSQVSQSATSAAVNGDSALVLIRSVRQPTRLIHQGLARMRPIRPRHQRLTLRVPRPAWLAR